MPKKRRIAVIVTALPLERKAITEHLREITEEPPLAGSIYRRGIFDERSQPWEIIVAEIGAKNAGAAAETERVLSHYSPEVALFVGIAGALKDVKHGDVVASTKVYGYESGKDDKGGFKPRPDVQLPSYGLEQRARFEAGEPDWRQRIRASGEPLPTMVPVALVGPIAAGEKVLASNRSRIFKFIRDAYSDAIAVEMEGIGFLHSVHMNQPTQGIVVRGISDLVEDKDEENDEKWQPVAASHAAAFAFQILSKYPDSDEGESGSLAAELDNEWQEKHLQDAKATAGPRYSMKLRVGTPLHDIFEALGNTETWLASVRALCRKTARHIDRFLGCLRTKDSNSWGAPFPEHLLPVGVTIADLLKGLSRGFDDLTNPPLNGGPPGIAKTANQVLTQARGLYTALLADFEMKHGKGKADSASFRQHQAQYLMSFPTSNLDATRELITNLEEMEHWGNSGPGRANGSRGMLLLGGAGVGKTHGICDIAHDRFTRGLFTVVLFGEHFTSTDEPWDRIRQILGFSSANRDEILTALDEIGSSTGHFVLLCIDGLNESRPRGYWRTWLPSLVSQVARFPNIRLCVSCRSTYEQVVIPEAHSLNRIQFDGFSGIEFSATRQFFMHYDLEPPVSPSFHPEFSNPLFLRLVCQTLQAAGMRRMPVGWHGLNTAFQAFLREKSKIFGKEFDRDAREKVPQRALHEFMAEVENQRQVYLLWNKATEAIGRAHPPGFVGPTVLDWLVREGLLIADIDPNDCSTDAEEIVRIAFERLGDHLFAELLLSNMNPQELDNEVQSGRLSFAFASVEAIREYRGLVEALTIQVAEQEKFSVELVDVVPSGATRFEVLKATISALPWRDPEHMTCRTQQIIFEGLSTNGYAYEVMDNLLGVATQVTAPDALWLHGLLAQKSMRFRDEFLCVYVYQIVEKSNSLERLLVAPFELDTAKIPESIILRWATLLLWFCVAADRRVRDRATKGLVSITQSCPNIWIKLIESFVHIDDEYVVERCFCAAYGTLLRTRDLEAESEIARITYDSVLANSSIIQNALIRDHARCIIDLAKVDGVLPASIRLKRSRPRYVSDWPLVIPSEDNIEIYAGSFDDYPKLYISCLIDDFFTYTLARLDNFEHIISRKEMGRWILNHIIFDMGYSGDVLAHYDGYMLHTYGSGRGRPGWADRIGKKYQWIALSRLAARLADHLEPKPGRSWGPKIRGVPLVYSRGRDIDPSLLISRQETRRDGAIWWLLVDYDFSAAARLSNPEWVATSCDFPSSESMLQPIVRPDGSEWQLLEGYPTWSAKSERDDEDSFAPYRRIWTHIRGCLVKRESANRVFDWIGKKKYMGRWMPEGADFHEGYVGEYPWGILFTMYPDSWFSRSISGVKAPVRLIPVCNSISSTYEGDAYQNDTINIHLPARIFFEQNSHLRWDGLSGYGNQHGQLIFCDPSVSESGPPALLVNRPYLLEFLERHELAIIWSILGEKNYIGGFENRCPNMVFAQTHLLDQSGVLRSSESRTQLN